MGGFECSTHRNRAGRRVDVIAATRHDHFARADYQRLLDLGIRTARDGARWHLIEQIPRRYDFSSVAAQIHAARQTNIQIIWDLFHYGCPDKLDIFSPEFVSRFAEYAGKFTEFLLAADNRKPFVCLVNEISFFAWAAGQVGIFYPFQKNRGDELKRQLVKASITAAAQIKRIAPNAVLIQTDPAIRVVPSKPENTIGARDFHRAQYHALDMLLGQTEPEIGGSSGLIDVIGVNYYPYNQWRCPSGRKILRGQKNYQPFNEILREFYARYQNRCSSRKPEVRTTRAASGLNISAMKRGQPKKPEFRFWEFVSIRLSIIRAGMTTGIVITDYGITRMRRARARFIRRSPKRSRGSRF